MNPKNSYMLYVKLMVIIIIMTTVQPVFAVVNNTFRILCGFNFCVRVKN